MATGRAMKLNRRKTAIAMIVVTILSSILTTLVNVSNVFALSSTDDKFKARDLLMCYSQRMEKEIVPNQVSGTKDLLLSEWKKYRWSGKTEDESTPLGALRTTEGTEDEIGCTKLLESLGFTVNGSNGPDVLTKLGYQPQTTNGKCVTIDLQKYNSDNDSWSNFTGKPKLCASSVDSNGVIQGELLGYEADLPDDAEGEFSPGFHVDGDDIHLYIGAGIDLLYTGSYSCGILWMGTCYNYLTYEVGVTKWSDLVSNINTYVQQGIDDMGGYYGMMRYRYTGYNEVAGGTSAVSSYKMGSFTDAFLVGYKNAFGEDYTTNSLQVGKKEQATLYQNYLSNYYGVKSDACASTKDKSTEAAANLGSSWVQTKVYGSDGKAQYCYINATKNTGNGVYGIVTGSLTAVVADGRLTWQELAEWLLNNGPDSIDPGSVTDDIINNTDTSDRKDDDSDYTDSKESEEEACYQQAGSMGWIICPIIFGLSDSDENMYNAVEPLLRVHDSIIEDMRDSLNGSSDNKSIYGAWNTFRGMANILFVILFLVVIFSQLTGFGIDNYGIKKMLPKLIVSAILINLSFIVCALVVDMMQIIGDAIVNLFVNISPALGYDGAASAAESMSEFLGNIIKGAVGAIGVSAILSGWTVIIPILLFLLTTLVSVIFALILLGLRQAIVIILIIISPLAIAFYALPNTQSISKKWVDISKNIIMLYPICSALIGGSYFASHIMLQAYGTGGSVDDVLDLFMTILAGLLCVVPYFMIPSLTRKAVDGIGSLGSKIGNIGSRLGQGASNKINNSRAVQNARQNAQDRANARKGWAYMNTLGRLDKKKLESGKRLSHGAARRYTNALNAVNAKSNASIAARSAQGQYQRMSGTGFAAAMANAGLSEDATAVSNYESLITGGQFGYTNKEGKSAMVDSQDNESLGMALRQELEKGINADDNKIRALSNKLAANGKEGRTQMYDAVTAAIGSGNVKNKAVKAFAGNIMSNHAGTMKDKHRSLYELAKENANIDATGDNATKTFSLGKNYGGAGVMSLSTSDMANMDVQQLNRYKDNVSDDDRGRLVELAQQTLADEHLSKDLNGKQRNALNEIIAFGGASGTAGAATTSAESTEVKIDHTADRQDVINRVVSGELTPAQGDRIIEIQQNPTPAEKEFMDRLNKRVEDGTYTREQADDLIRKMADRSIDKNPNR